MILVKIHQAIVARMQATEFCEEKEKFPSNKLDKLVQQVIILAIPWLTGRTKEKCGLPEGRIRVIFYSVRR